jgi:hypothetical protein
MELKLAVGKSEDPWVVGNLASLGKDYDGLTWYYPSPK